MSTVDQVVGRLEARLNQAYQELQALLQQAGAGCQSMIASRPDDLTALYRALGAIMQQARALPQPVHQLWGNELYGQLAQLAARGTSVDAASDHCERLLREGTQWIEDQWERFETYWRMEGIRAMWPVVEEALARAPSCTRCGAPLTTRQRRVSESVTCPSCRVVNQTTPEQVVATYFLMAPDVHARHSTIDLKQRITQYRNAWANERAAIKQRTGTWVDEPIESLRTREQLERAYWTAYAAAKAQIEPHDEAGLIESRMKDFYDEMARNEVWRAAHAMGPSQARLQAQLDSLVGDLMDWGPLHPQQVEENFYHEHTLQDVETEPAQHQRLLARFGYRDAVHRAVVSRTFTRHYQDQLGADWFEAAATAGAMRSMRDRGALLADLNAHLLAPIEGVSLELYAALSAQQSSLTPEQFLQILAQHQLDREKLERVSRQWMERMSTDASDTLSHVYSKAFDRGMAAVEGAAGREPASLELYAEISGAMTAWSQQGKDISAMLQQHFRTSAAGFSNMAAFWHSQIMNDPSIADRISQLSQHYEKIWLAR